MGCQIGHARGKSLGSAAAGDHTTGNEVSITGWYYGSWTHVFRPKKRSHAKKLAQAMKNACNNNNIGYLQDRRNTAWARAAAIAENDGWSPECLSKITADCDTDCSALVHLCCQCAGIYIPKDNGNSMTTHDWSEIVLLPNSGAFYTIRDSKYTGRGDYLRAGDILRSAGHTALVVEDGNLAFDLDEYPQENDATDETPASLNDTGKKEGSRNDPVPTFYTSEPQPGTNKNDLDIFKRKYYNTYGKTFSWATYNSSHGSNTAEYHNDYSALMINYILVQNINRVAAALNDEIFNQWATARLVKMLNSGYNIHNAAALERTLRLYPKTSDNDIKKVIKEYICGVKNSSNDSWNNPSDNNNTFKTALKKFYLLFNQTWYNTNNDDQPIDFNKRWNEDPEYNRQEYFADVIIENENGYTIGEMLDTDVTPSKMNISDFDNSLFGGQLMQYLFYLFIKEHPTVLLWKYESNIQYYPYVKEDADLNGLLYQDWMNMIKSKSLPNKDHVIDVYSFTKYKDFALNATVNNLNNYNQTAYLKDGILVIENKVASNQIDIMREWDDIVPFRFYTNDYEYYPATHWAYIVDEAPYNLLFWLEFLDTDGELSRYSVPAIGPRQKAINDNKIRVITYESTPNIIFTYQRKENQYLETFSEDNTIPSTGYIYIYLPDQYKQLFTVSAQGKTAKEALDELLYNNTHAMETMNITSLPIYYLNPNNRIGIYDNNIGVNHEYIINKITLPLQYNGTMSLQVSKTIDRLY